MVFAGRGPSPKRIDHLCRLVRKIKENYPIRICISAGIMDKEAVRKLKEAGLDRLNHNLNTSERHYKSICTTHTFQDRMETLMAAKEVGLEICSGLIVGMGEEPEDVIEVAMILRELKSPSIPVNFLVPIEGNVLSKSTGLTPEYCLRVLCLYRFLNPKAEIRVAAGREGHLRSMEVMSLYPANSLFLDGYLNTRGSSRAKTLRMIKDAGFEIVATQTLDDLLKNEEEDSVSFTIDENQRLLKNLSDLRPQLKS
jgi:biotin synthase